MYSSINGGRWGCPGRWGGDEGPRPLKTLAYNGLKAQNKLVQMARILFRQIPNGGEKHMNDLK